MAVTLEQLEEWMNDDESEHLEFKAAKNGYQKDKLFKYAAALANEGGGHFILGVTDKKPRRVEGTNAFLNLAEVKHELLNGLHFRVDADELIHADGRVVVFSIPPRPIGTPRQFDGIYWMRSGESLVAMTADKLRSIFDEDVPDFSAHVCGGAIIDDLDENAVAEFRERWIRKSGREALRNLSKEQLLTDAELINDSGITYAALILLGTRAALGRHLAQCEIVFEYRSNEAAGAAQQREEYRQGYFLFLDDIWKTIDLRNDLQHFSLGMTVYDIPTFDERAVREAILNAVSHRDYRMAGSIFVRQYPRRLEVVSPGGFPAPVSRQNVLRGQMPRNRRVAEVLVKCGLVERSGQGFNLIYEQEIKQGKPLPDLTGTDEHQVFLTLHGQIQDPQFLRFLERLGAETVNSFTTEELLALHQINSGYAVDDELQPQAAKLLRQDLILKVGSGKQSRFVIAPQFYDYANKRLSESFKQAIERAEQKVTLLKRIVENEITGTKLAELMELLPASLTRRQVQGLLQELKDEKQIHSEGLNRAARWFSGA